MYSIDESRAALQGIEQPSQSAFLWAQNAPDHALHCALGPDEH